MDIDFGWIICISVAELNGVQCNAVQRNAVRKVTVVEASIGDDRQSRQANINES